MTSYEPLRTDAYSEDLRWRIVWQSESLGYSQRMIARNLGVDQATVSRTIKFFYTTGSVTKRPYPKERACRKLTTPCQLFLLNLVVQQPGIYLHEIQREVQNFLQLTISIPTICRFLQENGFSRQKLRQIALQRDDLLRKQYIIDVSLYSTEMFIFVDETGADNRNRLRKYGYSVRGKPARNHSLLVRGERVSAVACMSVNGILDVKTVKGTCNGDIFYDFVQECLIPHLMPYNGINPHSIVVLDNCAIHHVQEVEMMLEEVGVLVHYLPPYSPDFNPIEEAFSKVKYELKADNGSITDIETLLLHCFASINTDDCYGWIGHTGIYNQV